MVKIDKIIFLLEMIYVTSYFGATDAMEEGTWVWEDGEPFSFSNWGSGEPNGGTSENCLDFDYYGIWNDIPCTQNYERAFICASPLCKLFAWFQRFPFSHILNYSLSSS
jgi:hypothetical protein